MTRVAYLLSALFALVLGLEGATRVDEWVRWREPLTSTTTGISDIITIDSSGARGLPHARYRKFVLNSLGLRGPEPHAGRPRVLVLGASESFGLYESPAREYPRQLEDSLAAAGCRVDVLNAALPGFSLPTLLSSFGHGAGQLGAAVAVVYPTPVQYLEAKRPAFHPPASAPRAADGGVHLRVVSRLRDHAKLVLPDWIKTQLRQREISAQRQQMTGDSLWRTVPSARIDDFITDVGALLDTLQAHHVTPVLATHANAFPPGQPRDEARLVAWAKFYPQADQSLLPVFDSVANVRLRQLAESRQVALVDAAQVFASVPPADYFADFSHFTDRGAGRMAGQLAGRIVAQVGCPH